MKYPKALLYITSIFLLLLFPSANCLAQSQVCELPGWFFNNSNFNNPNLAVGISDAGMEEEEAYKQARTRALVNNTLLHNAKFSSLTTSNLGNDQNDEMRYIIYTAIIKGTIGDTSNISVVDSFYTKNKEAIVLVDINDNDSTATGEFTITRRGGFHKENLQHPMSADELEVKIYFDNQLTDSLTLFKEKNKIQKHNPKRSKFIFEYVPEKQLYRYLDVEQSDKHALPTSLNAGLWNAYLFNLVDQICIYNSFNNDFHHKLSTSNIGNIIQLLNQETIQQFVYSIKNVQSKKINTQLVSTGIKSNQLKFYFKPKDENYDFRENLIFKLNKRDRKELKSIEKDNWQIVGDYSIENAWFTPKYGDQTTETALIASAKVRANDLNSGIIQAIQLAKLELSSLLEAKIASLTKLDSDNENQSQVKAAKLLNITKTEQIKPFYLFYRMLNSVTYEVKVVLFYEFGN